jgi:O6-methylguanine-DNA--protein-cysteine methyltransferase
MTRASYLWRRAAAFWFQIAVPDDLSTALGKPPLRIRLPARNQEDASRYARVLAGAAERGFQTMRSKRLGRYSDLELMQGTIDSPRQRILESMLAEIGELFAMFPAAESTKTRRPASDETQINDLNKRNTILEGLVVSLREKAREFAQEHADFVADANSKNRVSYETRRDLGFENDILSRDLHNLERTASWTMTKLQSAQAETESLAKQIVASGRGVLAANCESRTITALADTPPHRAVPRRARSPGLWRRCAPR